MISVLKDGYMWVIFIFSTKSLHKYTRVARGQDGVVVISVNKDMLCYVQHGDHKKNATRPLRLSSWWVHGLRGDR